MMQASAGMHRSVIFHVLPAAKHFVTRVCSVEERPSAQDKLHFFRSQFVLVQTPRETGCLCATCKVLNERAEPIVFRRLRIYLEDDPGCADSW
jgi:hypothetical protein